MYFINLTYIILVCFKYNTSNFDILFSIQINHNWTPLIDVIWLINLRKRGPRRAQDSHSSRKWSLRYDCKGIQHLSCAVERAFGTAIQTNQKIQHGRILARKGNRERCLRHCQSGHTQRDQETSRNQDILKV